MVEEVFGGRLVVKVLIVGAGAIGSVIGKILQSRPEFEEIILADLKQETAQRMIGNLDGPAKMTPIAMNANNVADMKKAMRGVDLVINATLPRFFLKIMKASLESGANYMDMATDIDVANSRAGDRVNKVPIDCPLEQADAWKSAGLAAMVCWGADPGAVNVFARFASDQLDSVDRILVRDGDNASIGGFNGLVSLWSPDTFIEEVAYADALVWTNGHYERLPSLTRSEEWNFPAPIGKLRVWAVDHEEPQTLARFIKCNECNFMISLSNDTVETMRVLKKLGLVSPSPINVKGVEVVPRDVVTACMPSPVDHRLQSGTDGYTCVGSMVIGEKAGKRYSHYVYNIMSHTEAYAYYGVTATALQTALPPATAATLLARGQIREKGVFPPEALAPNPIMKAFTELGFQWNEVRKEETPILALPA